MMQSISAHFRLSAKHTDQQVKLHVLQKKTRKKTEKNSGNAQISDVSNVKTAKILF